MKSGKVLIPFVDYKTGKPYQINDEFTGNKKRFEELLKAGLISDGKEIEKPEEPTDLEDTENQETNEDKLNDGSEDDSEDNENDADEKPEEPTDNVDLENTEE